MKAPEIDCTHGCGEDCPGHKWEIEPHPNGGDFDIYVCDDDQEARTRLMEAAEMEWDGCEIGEERILKIRRLK